MRFFILAAALSFGFTASATLLRDNCAIYVPNIAKGFRGSLAPDVATSTELLYPLLREGDPTDLLLQALEQKGYQPIVISEATAELKADIDARQHLAMDFNFGFFFFFHPYVSQLDIGAQSTSFDIIDIPPQMNQGPSISHENQFHQSYPYYGMSFPQHFQSLLDRIPQCQASESLSSIPTASQRQIKASLPLSVQLSCTYYEGDTILVNSGGRSSSVAMEQIYHSAFAPVSVSGANRHASIPLSAGSFAPAGRVTLTPISPISTDFAGDSYLLTLGAERDTSKSANLMRIDVAADGSLKFKYFDPDLNQTVKHPQLISFTFNTHNFDGYGTYICLIDFEPRGHSQFNGTILNASDINAQRWLTFAVKGSD